MADELVAGRYRLDTPLGGGMSEVWLAEDTKLGRRVALKLLGPGADPAGFDREGRAVAALADGKSTTGPTKTAATAAATPPPPTPPPPTPPPPLPTTIPTTLPTTVPTTVTIPITTPPSPAS